MRGRRLQRRLRRSAQLRAGPVLRWAFNNRLVAGLSGRSHVLCIGDSHAQVMGFVRVPRTWIRVVCVEGATATGICNPESTTEARQIFDRHLKQMKPWQQLLIMLGEVDCGCAMWRRASREGISVRAQAEETLDYYEAFLRSVTDLGIAGVYVLSVPLPAIDVPVAGDVTEARMEVTASQRERTCLTLDFNLRLRERCRAMGLSFIDVSDGLIDPATELIREEFVKRPRTNQHLCWGPYARLISGRLREQPGISRSRLRHTLTNRAARVTQAPHPGPTPVPEASQTAARSVRPSTPPGKPRANRHRV